MNTQNNRRYYHQFAATATNSPTRRNCLLAARRALNMAEGATGHIIAWRWITRATSWCEQVGIDIAGVSSGEYYPQVGRAKNMVDQALRNLEPDTQKGYILEALHILEEWSPICPAGSQWLCMVNARDQALLADVDIWDSLGMNHIPNVDAACEFLHAALTGLSQEGTN